MATTTGTIDIAEVIDRQRWRGFLLRFTGLICVIALFDGYDFSCMAFAAPSLIRDWNIDKGLFGAVFAAATFGGIVGGFLFGYVSDYWGRKPTAIAAQVVFGVFSLLTVFTTNVEQLLVLRFVTGIGIGGLLPLIFTVAVEFAPQRFRATVTMTAVISVGLGIMLAGLVGAALVPVFGWHVVFWIGGAGPLAMGTLAFFALPESPRFLLSRKQPGHRVAEVLHRINRSFAAPADAIYIDGNKIVKIAAAPVKYPALMLFRGRLAVITPLLWAAYFLSTVAPAIVITWLPVLGEGLGIAPSFAAFSVSIGGVGVIVSSLILMVLLERFGFGAVWPWPLIAVPALVVLGFVPVNNIGFILLLMLVGFAGGGTQGGMHASVGQFYPDECRGTGVSWAVCISRFGGVVGPLFAGVLLSRNVPAQTLFLLMTVPIVLFSVIAFTLGRFNNRTKRDAGRTLLMTEGATSAAKS